MTRIILTDCRGCNNGHRKQAPATVAQAIRLASEIITDDGRLELRTEPGRALSETEAADAIRAGLVVEVVG